jgi:hypothetical protein
MNRANARRRLLPLLALPLALTACGGGFVLFWSDDDDRPPPRIVIENPTTDPFFTTNVPVLALGGSVAHARRVVVSNTSTGEAVEAQQTNPGGHGNWFIDGLALALGSNVLAATAEGRHGATDRDFLTVNRLP